MSGWPKAILGEICSINPRFDRAQRPDAETPFSFVPMAAVDEVGGAIVSSEVRPYRSVAKGYTTFRNGDVLFAKITPCMENGKAAIAENLVGGIGFGSTEFHVLRPGPYLDRSFLFHLIRLPEFRRQAKAQFTGTAGQQRVPTTFLQNFALALPSIEEQRRIVDILDRAASIRRLRRQAQETASQIVPALFNKMFGDPQPEVMGWPTLELGNLLAPVESAIRTGPFGSQLLHSEFVSEGVPVLGIDNVVRNHFRWAAQRCIPIEKFERLRRFTVRPRDLLITIMGTTGRCAVAPDDLPPCISTKHLCVLTLNERLIVPEVAWAALLFDPFVRSQVARTGHGAIMEGWNMGLVKRLSVRVPPLSLQAKFAERVASIMGIQEQHSRAAIAEAWATASIQSRLFSA